MNAVLVFFTSARSDFVITGRGYGEALSPARLLLVKNESHEKAKKEPAAKYEKNHEFDLSCTGLRKSEGGNRATSFTTCFTSTFDGPDTFRPLFWLTDKDKQDYKEHYGLKNSDCYEVWGMKRTGCCGCPYGKNFEQELELIKQFEPKFYKAVNNIFGASYEYTRGYLKFREIMKSKEAGKEDEEQMSIGGMNEAVT